MNQRAGLVRGLVLFVLIVAAGLIMFSFSAAVSDANNPPTITLDRVNMSHYDVYRFADLNGKATCWLYTTYHGGGISCIATESIQQIRE